METQRKPLRVWQEFMEDDLVAKLREEVFNNKDKYRSLGVALIRCDLIGNNDLIFRDFNQLLSEL